MYQPKFNTLSYTISFSTLYMRLFQADNLIGKIEHLPRHL